MANVPRYDPLADIDDFLKGFFVRPVRLGGSEFGALGPMTADVREDDKAYTIHAELPGANKEDVTVTIDGSTVSVSAEVKDSRERKQGEKVIHSERRYGTVSRRFTLGAEIDEAQCGAKFKDGVLELVLPKKSGARTRQVKID